MAPPRNPNPAFPHYGFTGYNVTVTVPQTGKQRTYTDYRPVSGRDPVTGRDYNYDILTDDVLNSGNLEVLTNFRKAHENELRDPKNAAAKEYLDARIQTAKRFQDRRGNSEELEERQRAADLSAAGLTFRGGR